MPLSEKTKEMWGALPPERRANVMRLVAEKLTNEKLRRMQQQGEEPERRSGAEPGSGAPARDER
ncbi:MAG: hypothetical protein KUL87_04240 [Pseudomonas sp.]|jgi:hypothetical protein|nr:hypothetical protein [Pseudomonas sp.]